MKPLRPRRKCISRKRSLNLPELEQCKNTVLNSLPSFESKRAYRHAIDHFIEWYCSEPRLALNRIVVLRYRQFLEAIPLAAATVNLRLGAVRRLAYEAADTGLLSPDMVAGIRRVKGVKRLGQRTGNWLTLQQTQDMMGKIPLNTLRSKRDAAIVALLVGCGLRRSELVALEARQLQLREDHWTIVDLIGKGARVRTVPIPTWVKSALDQWLTASAIASGRLFRPIRKDGKVWAHRVSPNVIYHAVKRCAARIGIGGLAPHDLRRSCARLCHAAGGELEQIQFLLGHSSVQTTECYIGCKQRIGRAVNDRIEIQCAGQDAPVDETPHAPMAPVSSGRARSVELEHGTLLHNEASRGIGRDRPSDTPALDLRERCCRTKGDNSGPHEAATLDKGRHSSGA
jgi:integrase